MNSKNKIVYLIRHPDFHESRDKRESWLTDDGKVMADAIATQLAREQVEGGWAIFTSPVGRAVEPGEIIGERLGVKPRVDKNLGDMISFGMEKRFKDVVCAIDDVEAINVIIVTHMPYLIKFPLYLNKQFLGGEGAGFPKEEISGTKYGAIIRINFERQTYEEYANW